MTEASRPSSCPTSALTPHSPSAPFAPASLVSLPLLGAPVLHMLFPLPGKLSCTNHLADSHTCQLTQLSCHFLRASRVPLGSLVSEALAPSAVPSYRGSPVPTGTTLSGSDTLCTAHLPLDCGHQVMGTESSTTCSVLGPGPGLTGQRVNKQRHKHSETLTPECTQTQPQHGLETAM